MLSQSFTCISCRVAFQNTDFQRLHYKTDWHRYNLKRKVASLPPVTAEEFQRRVLLQKEQNEQLENPKISYCEVCRKKFNTQNNYEAHMNSKKHQLNILNNETKAEENVNSKLEKPKMVIQEDSDTDSEIEEVDSDEWTEDTENPISIHNCLFCSNHSRNLVKNIKHMSIAHTFFVPDLEFVVDIKGLLLYLGEKISSGFMCIWCQKTFYSFESVQQHMVDKGHTKIFFEGEGLAEFTDFYDYSKSYPDDGKDPDSIETVPVLDDSDYQLVLPSGSVIGHRSLFKYYK